MARPSQSSTTLSIRINQKSREKLETLSDATGRSKSFLAAEAIENYLDTQTWQVEAIAKAVTKADSKEAHFISHNKVEQWVNSWDTDTEMDMPK